MDIFNQLRQLQTVDWVIICTATIAYVPLWMAIAKDKKDGAGQNFVTWILWFVLDITQFICTILANGTYIVFFAFTPCCLVTMILVFQHKRKISPLEKPVIWLVIVSIPAWILLGERSAIVIQTVAQIVAGIPLLKDTWQKTEKFKNTLFPLSLFVIVHVLTFFRYKSWTIEDKLFPGALLVYTILTMVPIVYLTTKESRKRIHP